MNRTENGREYYVEWTWSDAPRDRAPEVGTVVVTADPDAAVDAAWPQVVEHLVKECGEPEPVRSDWRVAAVIPWDSDDPYDARCSHRITITQEAADALDEIGAYDEIGPRAEGYDGVPYVTLNSGQGDIYDVVVRLQRELACPISEAIVEVCRSYSWGADSDDDSDER